MNYDDDHVVINRRDGFNTGMFAVFAGFLVGLVAGPVLCLALLSFAV